MNHDTPVSNFDKPLSNNVPSPGCRAFRDEDECDEVAPHAAHAAGHPQQEEEPGDGGDEPHQDPRAAAEGHRYQEASPAAKLEWEEFISAVCFGYTSEDLSISFTICGLMMLQASPFYWTPDGDTRWYHTQDNDKSML